MRIATYVLLILLCGIAHAQVGQIPVAITPTAGGGGGTATFTAGVGGTYADINAAVTAICAGTGSAITGSCPSATQVKNIAIQVTSGGITTTTQQTIAGWAAGSHTTIVEPDSSGGFRAYVNAHSGSPAYFNTAYGGYILQNSSSSGVSCLDANVNNITVFGIQMEAPNNAAGSCLVIDTNAVNSTVDSNILTWASGGAGAGISYGAPIATATLKNNIIVGLNTTYLLAVFFNSTGSSQLLAYYNTIVMTGPTVTDEGVGFFLYNASTTSTVIENNATMNLGLCGGAPPGSPNNDAFDFETGGGSITGSNNTTCFSVPASGSAFYTNGQYNATMAEFVSPTDFHLASGSLHMRGCGVPAAGGVTVDMFGTTRSGTYDDVGAVAFSGSHVPCATGATEFYAAGSGGTYADINAAVTAVCAGTGAAVTGSCPGGTQTKNIVIEIVAGGITSSAAQQTIDGWTAGTFTNVLQPDYGGGFRKYVNFNGGAAYYNTTYGSYLQVSGGYDTLHVNVNNFTMFGIQSENTADAIGIVFEANALNATIDSSMIFWTGYTHTEPGVITPTSSVVTIKNTIIDGLDTSDALTTVYQGSQINMLYDTLFMTGPTLLDQGGGIFFYNNPTSSSIIENVAAMGFGSCGGGSGGEANAYDFSAGGGAVTGSNNTSCFPSPGSSFSVVPTLYTNAQFNAVTATEFVSATDFHLAPGSAHMRGCALVHAQGITVDMFGNPRSGTYDDVGAVAYAGTATPC